MIADGIDESLPFAAPVEAGQVLAEDVLQYLLPDCSSSIGQ
jgi:hypothetical protein